MKKTKDLKFIFFCICISFISITITSKNSFLYVFNDWCDINSFFTIGKGMINGIVPYRDIFEQKGPILYLMFALSYLISNTSFIGVYLLELISFSVFLYYTHKTVELFLDKKASFIIIPIVSVSICTAFSFVHGGSCEEFCLPYMAVCMYYFLKYFKGDELSSKIIFINGLLAGIVFMMKYTILGVWIAFMMCITIDLIFIKKNFKKALKYVMVFLLGFIIPFALCLIYFAFNNAIDDFIRCYFVVNMTSYTGEVISIGERAYNLFESFFSYSFINGIVPFVCLVFLPFFILKLNITKFGKISILINLYLNVLCIYGGMRNFNYYHFPLLIFISVALIGIFKMFEKQLNKILESKKFVMVIIVVNIILVICCYLGANYKDWIGQTKEEHYVYEFVDYINDYEDPTILNMGYLDAGLYTLLDIMPNTYYYQVHNFTYEKYPENLDKMKEYVINKDIKFIMYYTKKNIDDIRKEEPYIFDNYTLVLSDKHVRYETNNVFLFKLNGLEK